MKGYLPTKISEYCERSKRVHQERNWGAGGGGGGGMMRGRGLGQARLGRNEKKPRMLTLFNWGSGGRGLSPCLHTS